MKGWVKNLICFSVVGLSLIAICFTLLTVYSYGGGGKPGDMPHGQMQGQGSTDQPPAKPDGESGSSSQNNQGGQNSMGQPPAKPDGETNGGEQSQSRTKQPPAKPDGEQGANGPGDGMQQMSPQEKDEIFLIDLLIAYIADSYYYTFLFESLVLFAFIMFLIMSKCNKLSFKETFAFGKTRKAADKKGIASWVKFYKKRIIYVVLWVVLTFVNAHVCMVILEAEVLDLLPGIEKPQGMGQNASEINYKAVKEIKSNENLDGVNIASEASDENDILVSGKISSVLKNILTNKTGDSSSQDGPNFYGVNSGIVAKDGANLSVEDSEINTNASGANGIFSFGGSATTNNTSGDGTSVTVKNCKIKTNKDQSGGIMTTGGGIMKVINSIIETFGNSSAAIRSDKGGGEVNVDGGTYTSNGNGSPAIYSTADITAKNCELISNVSEGVVIEGKNKVNLENVKLTDTNTKLNAQSQSYKNIFLYQSMSGDSDNGTAEFSAKNSSIVTNKGHTFFVTNTKGKITLENNSIVNNDNGNFLVISKAAWGKNGSNGGDVALSLKNQSASGNIVVDEISVLDMDMSDGSYYEGELNKDNTAKSIKLKLSKNSKIKLTGDAYVTSFEDEDVTYSNIDFNGHKLYVNGKAI